MTNTLAEQLRDACDKVRLKSYPLSDLIPLMQKAADELDKHRTVFVVSGRMFSGTFSTREAAELFVSKFAPSVGGGLCVSEIPVWPQSL